MPQTECPICLGTGVIKEDANQYEFVTREPISSRCLICNGSGKVWPCSKLPNGVAMHEMKAEKEQQKRLNVSKKAKVQVPAEMDNGGASASAGTPDTGVGYKAGDPVFYTPPAETHGEIVAKLRYKAELHDRAEAEIAREVGMTLQEIMELQHDVFGGKKCREVVQQRIEKLLLEDGMKGRGASETSLTTDDTEKSRELQREPYEAPMFLEMALDARLNKVLASGKRFLIVTETEPYYFAVYRMIREQERRQGTWTEQDEDNYVGALEEQIKRYQEVING